MFPSHSERSFMFWNVFVKIVYYMANLRISVFWLRTHLSCRSLSVCAVAAALWGSGKCSWWGDAANTCPCSCSKWSQGVPAAAVGEHRGEPGRGQCGLQEAVRTQALIMFDHQFLNTCLTSELLQVLPGLPWQLEGGFLVTSSLQRRQHNLCIIFTISYHIS